MAGRSSCLCSTAQAAAGAADPPAAQVSPGCSATHCFAAPVASVATHSRAPPPPACTPALLAAWSTVVRLLAARQVRLGTKGGKPKPQAAAPPPEQPWQRILKSPAHIRLPLTQPWSAAAPPSAAQLAAAAIGGGGGPAGSASDGGAPAGSHKRKAAEQGGRAGADGRDVEAWVRRTGYGVRGTGAAERDAAAGAEDAEGAAAEPTGPAACAGGGATRSELFAFPATPLDRLRYSVFADLHRRGAMPS